MSDLTIVGRSSSHFTRVTQIFARELGVEYQLHVVPDLLTPSRADYRGNPALRIPVLETEEGAWFGALNICRELARRAQPPLPVVWPEQLRDRTSANAQELVLQGMATEVGLIMRTLASGESSDAYEAKNRRSLVESLGWLDAHLLGAVESLPRSRGMSFLEVTSFCFLTHLEFRQVLDTSGYRRLNEFCRAFAERPGARDTPYRFDHA